MKSTCEEVRNWVPRALMSDLAPGEERSLNAHLAECACVRRRATALYRYLGPGPVRFRLFQFRSTSLSIPMSAGSSVMEFLRGLTPGWKLASSLAIGTMVIFAVLVAARFQFRAEQGILFLQFWPPSPGCHAGRGFCSPRLRH